MIATSRLVHDGVDHDDATTDPSVGIACTGDTVGTSLVAFGDPGRALALGIDPGEWARYAPTPPAEACLVRFAADEADVSVPDVDGLGRISTIRYPRLGGVLHGRIDPAGPDARLLLTGVEQTIRAGYHAALASHQVADVPLEHVDATSLWRAFVPVSYRLPRAVASRAWDICRFDDLWVALLAHLGLEGDANRFAKGLVSPLSRSIRGVSTVGVALALAERGGRYERSRRGTRAGRRPNVERRDLPAAPRVIGDFHRRP